MRACSVIWADSVDSVNSADWTKGIQEVERAEVVREHNLASYRSAMMVALGVR